MTFRIKNRGGTWALEGRPGKRLRRGTGGRKRIRLSLGTADQAEAEQCLRMVNLAVDRGPEGALWGDLRAMLPTDAFEKLAEFAGHRFVPSAPASRPTWADLAERFTAWTAQRVALDKMRDSTRARYLRTVEVFGRFLKERGITQLEQIRRDLVEDFKTSRLSDAKSQVAAHTKQLKEQLSQAEERGKTEKAGRLREHIRDLESRTPGRGVVLDTAILHRVFACGQKTFEIVTQNPVQLDGRPGDSAEHGAMPFKAADLEKLRSAAGEDLLTFLLLRWTGLRGSDAVGLRWEEIDWDAREIDRLTMKRRRRVVLPIPQELLFALEVERDSRQPAPEEHVLVNPAKGHAKGRPLTRPRLYRRIQMLGRRAGVPHAHPHRFRDTFAVDFLARGGSPYDVAKLLGDTVETVEKHYAPFVRELRERARRIMDAPGGLEKLDTKRPQGTSPERPLN